MLPIKVTAVKLLSASVLLFASFSLEAGLRDGDVVAIQIEKRGGKGSEKDVKDENAEAHVLVDERGAKETACLECDRIQVDERADGESRVTIQENPDCNRCGHCNRQVIVNHPPIYMGRVPVGPVYPRYGCGVVAYPCGRTPGVVFIRHCPPRKCQTDFSFRWRISG